MVKGLKIKLVIAFVLFCITVFLLFIDEYKPYTVNYKEASKEMFIPQLRRLNSIEKVVHYTDSMYSALRLEEFDTSRYVRIVSGTVKRRFYHGISNYSLSDNWIIHILGKMCWSHLSAIVNPDDILEYPEGLCSQQNIVFMEVLKKKGITTRAVGLGTIEGPGHFLSEVLYDNKWHLYDVDVEPNWKATAFNHESLEILLANKQELYKIYEGRLTPAIIDKIILSVNYGVPNKFPATKMLIFQKMTNVLTYVLPSFFLLLFIWYYRKSKQ
ncbi:MAG: hypothetical protein V4677_03840 [Bacteroidota bacterium]